MTLNEYSKYMPFKSAVEDLFGSDAWYALKESNHIPTWRKYAKRTLQAVLLSIEDTVEIFDEEWLGEIRSNIERGNEQIDKCAAIDEIVAALAGSLINVSFLQIGQMPRHRGKAGKYPLRKGAWRLDRFRSPVYLQSKDQREALFWSKQQNRIGAQAQLDLYNTWARSKSEMSYSEWCKKNAESA